MVTMNIPSAPDVAPPEEPAADAPAPIEAATGNPSVPHSEACTPRPPPPWRERASALFRLATLRRFDAAALPSSVLPGLVVGACAVAGWIAIDARRSAPVRAFEPYGFVELAWFVLGVLGIAAAMNIGSRTRLGYARALTLVGLVTPALLAGWLGWEGIAYGDPPQLDAVALASLGAPLAYAALVWLRGLAGLLARGAAAAWLWALVGLCGFGAGSTALGAQPGFWYTQEAEPASADDALWARTNALLFSQQGRIDEALRKIPAAPPGPPHAYFLGFAGFGDQKVFANEIALARRVVERRFDIGPRALSLLNDRRDVDSAPLASVSALRYALRRLGERMNVDKDVLVLALSSHGGEDATLSVTNGSLPFEDLTAQDLADALAKSGIRWRVIVISACHAGAFIPALKDANTIVITAAAPDRSSFGCADDRDLTYFGEAFWRDALPLAPSLRAAFDTARHEIHRRETSEGFTPSQPTAWFGPAMEAHVARVFEPPL